MIVGTFNGYPAARVQVGDIDCLDKKKQETCKRQHGGVGHPLDPANDTEAPDDKIKRIARVAVRAANVKLSTCHISQSILNTNSILSLRPVAVCK